jgi:hypothetical protein
VIDNNQEGDFMQQTSTRRRFGIGTIAMGSALALSPLLATAQEAKPQYGGQLNIGNVYVTVSPLSPDPADWPWKVNQDAGLTYEQLFVADLNKSKRKGGKLHLQLGRLAAARRVARRAGRELEDGTEPAARGGAVAQGRDVPCPAWCDGSA